MKLGELKPTPGTTKSRKRVGRGEGSGKGTTSGRGSKGYHSRSGSKRRSWFEGGQMPLQRRVPKRGFTNAAFKKRYQIVNISSLNKIQSDVVDIDTMYQSGLISTKTLPVKILGEGDVTQAMTVNANAFSKIAVIKLENAGGKAILI